MLDRQLRATLEGGRSGIKSKALSIKNPITGLLQSYAGLLVCTVVSVYLLVTAIFIIRDLGTFGISAFNIFHVIIVPTAEYDTATLLSFELLLRGCTVASKNISSPSADVNSVVAFEEPMTTDGFVLSMNTSGIGRVSIMGSADGGGTWHTFGSTYFRRVPEGVRPLDRVLTNASQRLRLDYSPLWPLVAESAVTNILLALGFLTTTLLAICGLSRHGKIVSVFACGVVSVNYLSAVIGYAGLSLPRDCFSPFVHCALFAAAASSFLLAEMYFPPLLIALGGASLVTRIVEDVGFFQDAGYLTKSPPYPQLFAILVGVVLSVRRHLFIRAAVRGLAESTASKEARWSQMTDEPDTAHHLKRLGNVCERVGSAFTVPCPPRQLCRTISGPEATSGLCSDVWSSDSEMSAAKAAKASGPFQAASSLDQVYSQALGLCPLFRAMCGRWATACGASLDDSDQRGTAAREPEVYGEIAGEECFRFLKDPARAVEKVVICYGGDASRLVDVCRGRLCFDRVEDLVCCLEAIHIEAGVQILRVKNLMCPGGNSRGPVGFRVRFHLELLSISG